MKKKSDLPQLLKSHDAVTRAVDTLIECLEAKRSFVQNGKVTTEPDFHVRAKASELLLAYSVGEPVKRQQILSGKMPKTPPSREELRQTLEQKIATIVLSDAVTLPELLAARKTLIELEGKERLSPLSEEEAVAMARRIHGITAPESSASPAPDSADNRTTLAQDTPSDARPPSHP